MHHTRRIALALGLIVTIVAFGIIFRETTDKKRLPVDANIKNDSFALSSPVFSNNQPFPAIYTCKGQNIRPPLSIERPPAGTQSFAIIMQDPDAVSGNWVHWTIWNIDATTTNIDENTLPQRSVEGIASSGKSGYNGPCPPAHTGVHRYVFEIYALDTILSLTADADTNQLQDAMRGHILAQSRLTGSLEAD